MSKKLIILVTASTFPRNENDSTPRFVLDLCKALQLHGDIECHVLAPHLARTSFEEVLEGVHVVRYIYAYPFGLEKISGEGIMSKLQSNPILLLLVPVFLFSQLIYTVWLINRLKPNILLSNWIIPQGFVTLLASLITGPIIKLLICHGGDVAVMRNNPLLRRIGKTILQSYNRVIAVSDYLKDEIEQKIVLGQTDTRVISMGVDISKYENIPTENWDNMAYPNGYMLFVGRIEEKKGLSYLLDAISRIPYEQLDIPLLIVGSGTLKNKMEQKAKSLGLLGKRVQFKGALPNTSIPLLLSNATISVFPSINTASDSEGLPTVILESIAARTPVLTTDAGGITDIIIHGVTGFIVRQQDSCELAKGILTMLSDRSLRERIAENAFRYVVDNYSYDAIGAKFRAEIDELLHSRDGER